LCIDYFHKWWLLIFVNIKNNLYIITGCNGAGKSTVSFTILPEILDCKEFVNADEIALESVEYVGECFVGAQ
jgi:ABC-type Mn2+/Zn2+ transport system ATPase subunit